MLFQKQSYFCVQCVDNAMLEMFVLEVVNMCVDDQKITD